MKIDNPYKTSSVTVEEGVCSPPAVEDDHEQEHFRTDHLLTNLKGRTVSSGAIAVTAQAAKFVLNLGSTVVLARLLTPRDFGLVAMVLTVTNFLRVFKDAGLSIATVQRERITQAQVSNLFWINAAVSVVSTLIVAGAAPLIAHFYHHARLVEITLLLSLTFLLSGSTVQHQALLKRQMRFKALAFIEVGSMAIGVVVGIVMAFLGYSYRSLVGQTLAMEASGLLLTWSISRWRPSLPSRQSGVRPLLSFGIHRTVGDFIASLARGTDNLLIGRFYGAMAVGLYSRASALLMRPLEQFLGPINTVFVPALSRLQSQPDRYRYTFLRLYEAVAFSGFFFTGLCLALARPLTLALLGVKWEQAAVIFGGFTIAALCVPLANASSWLFTSQGRGRDMLIAQSINAVTVVISFLIGLPFGPLGVATAFSIAGPVVRLPLLYYYVGKSGPVRTADLWKVFFRQLPVWVVVFFGTWLTLIPVGHLRPVLQLLIGGTGGVLIGILFVYSSRPQREVATHLLETLREAKKGSLKGKTNGNEG